MRRDLTAPTNQKNVEALDAGLTAMFPLMSFRKTKVSSELPVLGNKLNYLFGKATGSLHNVERSTGMLRQLQSIGIFDNVYGNAYLRAHLGRIYNSTNQWENIKRIFINGS